MKKITLLLLLFCSFLGYSQLETFEAGIPASWKVLPGVNGLGTGEMWKTSAAPNSPYAAYQGEQAAYVNNFNVGIDNTEEDWLIMDQRTVPANGQLRFFARQTIASNQLTKLEIRVSRNPVQDNQGAYEVVETFAEGDLNNLNGPIEAYKEHVIDLDDFIGQAVYVAFVRVYEQTTPGRGGDRFLIDNVNILSECGNPTVLSAPFATVYSTTALLDWEHPVGATSFEIEVLEAGENPTGAGTNIPPPPYIATDLTPETDYKYYVRTRCLDPEGGYYTSEWVGPFYFTTIPIGSVCADPLVIENLPYQVTGANTAFYGDQYDAAQGTALCGATPAGTNYLQGNEVFYSFTPSQAGNISITMTPLGSTSGNSSIFVYTGSCTAITSGCITGLANTGITPRVLSLTVAAGQTYYIVISSSAATPSISYNLLIQQENCLPKPASLTATSPTLVGTDAGITLGWDNPGAYSSFQIEVQPLNSPIPSGAGTDVSGTNSFIKTGLQAATQYQFWVRAECTPGSGIFTSWAGPFAFNTQVCDPANTCKYKFILTDTGNNGWGTNRMVVRQNGIVVFTLGDQIPTGGGPVEVEVPMCPNVPFDLYWSATGTSPGQCGVKILNSFDQLLYTKPTNLSAVNTVLFGPEIVKCDAPRCDLVPTNLGAIAITTSGATLTWASAPITNFEIYLVPALGATAPTASTPPTYTGTAADYTFAIPDALESDLAYVFYIRTPCSPNASAWAGPYTFTTLPTCFKPTGLIVPPASITLHNATFDWTNGQAGDNSWEILLIPGPDVPPPPPVDPVLTGGTLLFGTTADAPFTPPGDPLDNATVYYYYIRTVCAGDDKSRWSGPIKFNTLTCDPVDKCNYKFVLTNTNGNSWNGGRMQILQNGILITTIGSASINNANGVSVGLCPGESFEIFWSVAGTAPQNIGLSIQNPFQDVIFTKDPGEGTPLAQVYQGTTNCTPAACSKPTPVTVSNVTATTATITWTDVSTPGTSSVDLYVITTGGTVPENDPVTPPTISGIVGTPVAGSPNTYTYVLNTIDGTLPLLPSTSYTFYIRSNCGGTERSTWTILTPVTFVTKPANDLCIDAIPVIPNSGQSCMPANSVEGNTLSAAASDPFVPPLTGAGCGATNRDVWFKFVATATSHTINLNDVVPTPANTNFRLNYSVFSGPCDALVKINCFTNNSGVLTGLTISDTYYIRVYNSTTAANQSAKFKLCITSPPANDECSGALAVSPNPLWNCSAFTTSGNTLGATPSLPTETGTGCAGTDDDIWFKFVATSDRHVIYINDILFPNAPNVAAGTLNHTLYSGSCDGLVKMYCKNDKQSVATGLTIGNTYYIRIYTPAAVVGQYATFQLCVSTPPPPAPNEECATAIPVEINASTSCDLKTAGLISGATASTVPNQTPVCQGTADDDVWFSFVPLYTSHIISLEDIEGTITTGIPTSTLNYAVYSGSCEGLVRKFCFNGNNNENNYYNYIPGNTYYIRVWSSSPNPEVVKFNVCIKSFPTCDTKAPVCATGVGKIFENTTGFDLGSFDFVDNPVACLNNAPNPVYFTLNVDVTGPLYFDIIQNTDIDNVTGELLGTGMDVDYVCWGPFQQGEEGCEYPFPDCPSCPNNTDNANYYPHGNIMDCSWSINTIETLSLPNAQQGEYYILLITNYDSDPGEIKLVQTNADEPGAGTVICCGVELGPDVVKCANSTILNSQFGVNPEAEQPDAGSFKWYKGTDLIVGANQSTLEVFTSGVYRVTADCGLNPEEDTITVLLSPPIEPETPADYVVCDDATNDGTAPFTLDILQNQLGLADLTLYDFTYHLTAPAAENDDPGITTVAAPTPYPNNTMIYIRIESVTLSSCYAVVPVKLVVAPLPNPQFDFAAAFYCKNPATPNPVPDTLPGAGGTYTVVPATGLVINPDTGEIDLQASTANDPTNVNDFYTIRYTIAGTPENQCGDVWFEDIVKITQPPAGEFNYPQQRYCTNASDPSPQLATGSVSGVFSTDSPGLLVVDPATGIIDISESTEGGPYIVYNTIDATATSCGIVTAQTEVYITTLPLADFSYDNVPASNSYCQNEANPVLTLGTGSVAGIFSAEPAGLDITAAGVINLETSIASATPYTVYNKIAAQDGCQEAMAQYSITITAPATADFTYSPETYCSDSTVNPQPQFIGNAAAGAFSSSDPANLVVNPATGVVDIAASSPGTYTVTNFIADSACTGDTATATITIAERKTGTIAYSNGALFCKSTATSVDVTANIPTGGSYSSSTGLSINASTGTIDITASTAGTYTVAYTIPDQNDGCGIFRAETTVTILPEFALGFETGCEEQKYTVRVIPVDGSFDPSAVDYEWSGTGFETTPENNAIILSSKGIVTITVTTDQGCTSAMNFDSTNLNIGCVIQRGISPNNDGDNDFFDLSAYDVKHLGIFNRYGTEVFQWSNYVNEWGGQSNSGDQLTDGTYFYVIDLADGTNKTGWIYLNR